MRQLFIMWLGRSLKQSHSFQAFRSFFSLTHHICSFIRSQCSHISTCQVIKVVRVSGSEAYRTLALLTRDQAVPSSRQAALSDYRIAPRKMHLKKLYGRRRRLLDQALVVFFEAHHSYSGQDLLQIHLHGSRAVVSAVFEQLSDLGLRLAEKGEFTRRAVLNERMSLQQAEAINDLIHSQLEFERQIAVSNLMGKGEKFIKRLREQIIKSLTLVEAYIQFEDDQTGGDLMGQVKQQIQVLGKEVDKVVKSSKQLQTARQGVKVAIIGKPNVGKSTLINALTERDVAIVSPIPGTTRDLIESTLQLEGFRIQLTDTAGLRQTSCPIQAEGIRRTRASIEDSNFYILLLDLSSSQYYETEHEIVLQMDQQHLELFQNNKTVIVVNKYDSFSQQQQAKKVYVQNGNEKTEVSLVVSLREQGAQSLLKSLGAKLKKEYSLYEESGSQVFFTRARYIESLVRCCSSLEACQKEEMADLCSSHLRQAVGELEGIVGRVDSQDILDSIFSNFCIGK